MSDNTEVWRARKYVADRFNVNEDTIERWVEAGKFPQPVRFGPRVLRWRESEILAWEKAKEAA